VTVHGMRSTFMDWCHECTNHPKVIIDMALAHKVGDKVEAAYRRGNLLIKRTKLMSAWAEFCGKTSISSPAVVLFRKP
jgi:integrase